MKHTKLLLIISLIIFSCSSNQNKSISKIDEVSDIQKVENLKSSEDDSLSVNSKHCEKKDSTTTTNVDISREHLKVIIDGRIYYKKHISDFRVENTYSYRTKDNRSEYNIKTGKYNHNYQIPHGGKVIIRDTVK